MPADIVLMDGDPPLNREQATKLRRCSHAEGRARTGAAGATARLHLRVNAPRHLWVTRQGRQPRARPVAQIFASRSGERTQVFGQVTVHRGRDRRLRAALRPQGGLDADVRRRARPSRSRRARRAQQHDGEHHGAADGKGPLDKLAISVTSPNRPDLSESQLYTLIITGHLQLGGGTRRRVADRRRRRRWSAACSRRSCSRRWRTGCRSTC